MGRVTRRAAAWVLVIGLLGIGAVVPRAAAAFDGFGWGVPTRWTSVPSSVAAAAIDVATNASPSIASAPAGTRERDSDRHSTRTRWPRATSASQSGRPT